MDWRAIWEKSTEFEKKGPDSLLRTVNITMNFSLTIMRTTLTIVSPVNLVIHNLNSHFSGNEEGTNPISR